LLADFLLLLLDETDKATCESLHKVACDLLQQQQSDVQEALLGIFGPATATVRTPAIQKLRKNSKVLKMFADLLQRSKSKAKQTDDFVVVPPPAKVLMMIYIIFPFRIDEHVFLSLPSI